MSRPSSPSSAGDDQRPFPRHRPAPGDGLDRRRLLAGATGTALTAAVAWMSGPAAARAAAADDYETLRARWLTQLTGSGFDATAAPYADALATLGRQAAAFRQAMAPGAGGLWPDLALGSVSNHITQSYVRLKTLALAYVQPGTGLTGDAALAQQITDGLDRVGAQAYTAATATYDNWWDWQIGAPESLLDTCVLMAGSLSAAQTAAWCAAVDHFVPDSAVAVYGGTSTGANRVDLCRVIALRGVIGKDAGKISTAVTALSPVFPYVTAGDGLYADGSFVQHTWVPYTTSYGEVMINGLSRLFALLGGSAWAVTDSARETVLDSVTGAFAPFVHNGLAMDCVSGRAISRGLTGTSPVPQSDVTRGHLVMSDILRLAGSGMATAEQSASWKSMVKGWLERETFLPYLADPGVAIPELARAQALLADPAIPAAPEPAGHRIFGMDRAVHRRPGWTASISMCSARTTFYENGNGENLRGWHTNSGMLNWWGDASGGRSGGTSGDTSGDAQYSDAFWPTVDPYRLPGTTVSAKPLADAAGGAWGAPRPDALFAGGATDGRFAAVGQDLRGLQSTLRAKKSWFCLDDAILCLGAGITATDGTHVETIVDNRNLGPDGSCGAGTLRVDGRAQPAAASWTGAFPAARGAVADGVGAYLFPRRTALHALRQARTGSWHDINSGSSTQRLTRTYLTLWIDHGVDPVDAEYAYLLMPGAGERAARRREMPRVLANTAAVQAVEDPLTRVTAANFHAAGEAGALTADGPCSVLVRTTADTVRIAVSDPTHGAASVGVGWAWHGRPGRVVECDPRITATAGGHALALTVDTQGAYGGSFEVVVRRR